MSKRRGTVVAALYWILGVAGACSLLSLLLWYLPSEAGRTVAAGGGTAKEVVEIENAQRSTYAQILLGFGLLAGLVFTYMRVRAMERQAEAAARQAETAVRQARTAEDGQITERFSRAVGQLSSMGGGNLTVRLGGIYSLERIMRDSSADGLTVREVLAAWVREEAPYHEKPPYPSVLGQAEPRVRVDIQAAITVLGRNTVDSTGAPFPALSLRRVDLRGFDLESLVLDGVDLREAGLAGANLRRASLVAANFENANLRGASLENADLAQAYLHWADLQGATLEQARLVMADLEEASLFFANMLGADLSQAHLYRAIMEGSRLAGANLEDANLSNANLQRVNLSEARLVGAELGGADLRGADLSRADLERANLMASDLKGAQLKHAVLCGTNLSFSNLTVEQVAEAHSDDNTDYPWNAAPQRSPVAATTTPPFED